jgi:hypothetical protein
VKFGIIVDVEASRAIRQEEQAWPLPGERLKAVADRQKITPSGSKCRVPAAPVTGPLKSPARRDLAGPTPSKCELVHNRCLFFASIARRPALHLGRSF